MGSIYPDRYSRIQVAILWQEDDDEEIIFCYLELESAAGGAFCFTNKQHVL